MTQEKNRNTFLMVTLMALPVILGVMFIISKNMKNQKLTVSDQSLIIPDVDEIAGLEDDKAKIYRDEQTELIYKTNLDARNIASDKDFFAIDSDFGKDDGVKEQTQALDPETEQVLEQYREPEQKRETYIAQPNPSNGQPSAKTAVTTSTQEKRTRHLPVNPPASAPAPSQEEKSKRSSSMGVYTAGRTSVHSSVEVKMDQSKKYLRAVLEEDKVIQNGSNVIFVLSDDGAIEGSNHKRGSILYGRATQGREFFEINIYQVRSAGDGNIYPADLIVFDENYNRGIRSEGFLNEASKEEGLDAASQTLDEATRGATSVRALDVATRAITRTANRTTRSKPITIPLKKGYKVYLQPKQNEK